MHTGKAMKGHNKRASFFKAKQLASGETKPSNTLTLDFVASRTVKK
jgi:hypothetical protein